MTDNTRNTGGKPKGGRNAANEAILALHDSLDDMHSILETLDELGITTRDELLEYIDTLDAELNDLESVTSD